MSLVLVRHGVLVFCLFVLWFVVIPFRFRFCFHTLFVRSFPSLFFDSSPLVSSFIVAALLFASFFPRSFSQPFFPPRFPLLLPPPFPWLLPSSFSRSFSPPAPPAGVGGGGAPKGTIRRRRARLGGSRDRSWRFPLVNSAEYGPLPRPALRGGLSCPPLYLRMYDRGIKTRHAPKPRPR